MSDELLPKFFMVFINHNMDNIISKTILENKGECFL